MLYRFCVEDEMYGSKFDPHWQRIPFVSGDEYDYLTRWRHYIKNNHRAQRFVKRNYNKRWRRKAKRYLKNKEYEFE